MPEFISHGNESAARSGRKPTHGYLQLEFSRHFNHRSPKTELTE